MFSTHITKADIDIYEEMKSFGALAHLESQEGKHVCGENGSVNVICSDGDQGHDIHRCLGRTARHHGRPIRPHNLKLNGGPLLISSDELNKTLPYRQMFLEDQIPGSVTMKGIKQLVLLAHTPCKVAYEKLEINLAYVELLHMEAIILVEHKLVEIDSEVKTCGALHLDPGDRPRNGHRQHKKMRKVVVARMTAYLKQYFAKHDPRVLRMSPVFNQENGR